MKKIFTLLLGFAAFLTASADSGSTDVVVKKSGIWYSTQGMSPNGRYVCGSALYQGAFRWDTEGDDLKWVSATSSTSEMAFYDVADTGLLVGQDNEQHPAYYENDEWHSLSSHPGTANRVVGDGTVICGNEYFPSSTQKPYDVRPCVWYRQADGTYAKEWLPNPTTDWLGGEVQFNTARAISNDGRYVVGVQVEDEGRYYTCIIWEKQDDGSWSYSLPFVEKEYNLDEFLRIQAERPQLDDYIFAAPGQPGYFDQVRNFQRIFAEWQYELNTKGRTGDFYAMPPVIMSDTGYTLAIPRQHTEWTYTPGETTVGETKSIVPVTYDVKTKTLVEHTLAGGAVPFSVSEGGIMMTSDGYDAFIIDGTERGKQKLDDWLMENYGYDLWEALPDNTAYVTDQGISADGKKIFIMFSSVTLEGELDDMQLTMIQLPGAAEGINEVTVSTSAVKNAGNYDLQGRGIGADGVRHGIYVVNGKKVIR